MNKKVFAEGGLGVSFFYILSGFILAFNYQIKIERNEISNRQFWAARFARIYPMYLVSLLIALPLALPELGKGSNELFKWMGKFLANIFLLQSFIPKQSFYFALNVPAWSISDEMFFYLLFPLLIYLLVKKKWFNWAWIIFILIPVSMSFVQQVSQYFVFYINPLLRVADFLIGILLYQFYDKGISLFKNRVFANWMEISSLILFVIFFIYHNRIPMVYRYSCYYWIPMAMMIYSFAYQQGVVSKLLSARILVYLGEISFSYYLLHDLIIRYVYELNGKFSFLSNDYLITALIFVIALLASAICYAWIEKPCNRYLRKKLA